MQAVVDDDALYANLQRAALYGRIAQIHVNTDNSQKAVETTRQGLAEKGLSPASAAPLEYTEGMALIRMGRNAEGIAAFERALLAATRAGMVRLEATVRGNIADYYLRQNDYVRAEREARLAMDPSGKANDASVAMMASANLGFALMGQGRIAEGARYTDAVIEQMRQAGMHADLEAMLDEKGRMLEKAGLYKNALAVVRDQQRLQAGTARAARDQAIARLQEQFDASRRSQKIDHFKGINDRWGHGVGDAVLVEVARRLATAVRDTDMVLRWGGEEFLVYAPSIEPAHIAGMVKRVLETIGSAPVVSGTCTVPVSVTAGVVALPFAGAADSRADWQCAIRIADWALYQGKAQGRNQARIVTGIGASVDVVMAALDGTGGTAPAQELVGMQRVDGP